ncbi:MAG: PEP-CTERM sorting domain-containing protein [Armatimonadetes bacterium]|nr:PEP-CTERM sorting domain-containing protein [Armatimonadota bacterium]
MRLRFLSAAALGTAMMGVYAADIQSSQLGFLSDSGGYQNQYSDWGSMQITYRASDFSDMTSDGQGGFYGYLNVWNSNSSATDNWAVQNKFVYFNSASEMEGSTDGFWYALGNEGTNYAGTSNQYKYQLTAVPTSMMGSNLRMSSDTITQQDVLFGGGAYDSPDNGLFTGGTGQSIGATAKNSDAGGTGAASSKTSRIKVKDSEVDPIKEDPNHCGPGSVTKSLQYLKKTSSLLSGADLSGVYDALKGSMETTQENGTYLDKWISGKKKVTDDKKIPVSTEYISDPSKIDDIAKKLSEGADVELFVYQGKGKDGKEWGGHFAFVSEIVRNYDANGKLIGFTVRTLNDLNQKDQNAGNDPITYTFDSTGKCTSHGTGAKLYGFMVETPVPEPATLAALAIGAVALLRRRSR